MPQASVQSDWLSPPGGGKWHDLYPHLTRDPLPLSDYTSADVFERERDAVFRKVWLNIARVEQLPRAGDYLVFDLAVAKTSILLVRGQDGVIRSFHNMCSHRGTKLVWREKGNGWRFSCKAHGWTYGDDGVLRSVPDESNFFRIDKTRNGLSPIATDIWEGFVFINLDPEPSSSLREYLGAWATDMEGYPFAALSEVRSGWTVEVAANWKTVKDGFQESYHAGFLHKRTLPDQFGGQENPLGLGTAYHLGPHHGTFSAIGNPAHRLKPAERIAIDRSPPAGKGFATSGTGDSSGAEGLPPGVNRSRHPGWILDVNFIFPNLFIDVSAGGWFGYRMWPLAVDRTLWEIFKYAPAPRNAGERYALEFHKIALRDPLFEDARMAEQTQQMLEAGAKAVMHLQDHEILVRHDRSILHRYIDGPGAHATGGEALRA